MAGQIPERWDPDSTPATALPIARTELGSRRGSMGMLSVVTGTNIGSNPGTGVTNAQAVLTLDSVDGSGNITTNYLWVDRNGKLRIDTSVPLTDTQGTIVGTQS